MSSNDIQPQVEQILAGIYLIDGEVSLASCSRLRECHMEDNRLSLSVEINIPCDGLLENLQQQLVERVSETLACEVEPKLYTRLESYKSTNPDSALGEVKNLIAISSGKGGVGKSTTTINLALALKQLGASVGILDADIFGPSQSILSGLPPESRPDVVDEKFFKPMEAHGLQFMSMGFIATEKTPMVWRGPKASGALTQMLNQTAWQGLDYLLVDMPPGTGDIQLTLAQHCPLTAAVIVTTPQDIALLDAVKGIEMFRKVNVPILGIVENMSLHLCSNCGHEEAIFGAGGGERVSETYEAPLLAQLPLDLKIREDADSGEPTVLREPDGKIAALYRKAALQMAAQLTSLEVNSTIPNVVSIS
jgi:ATP-binding protein involved in chromosome partitioning